MNLTHASPTFALRTAGAAAILLGLIALIGAEAQILHAVRAAHGWVPAHCALAFLVAGIGLAAVGLALLLATRLSGVAMLGLAFVLFGQERGWWSVAGLERFFYTEGLSPYAQQVGMHTVLCFTVLGVALILLGMTRRWRARGLVLALLAAFILALPIAELIGFAFEVAPATEGFLSVTVFTAPAHLFVGWALLVFAWNDTPPDLRAQTYWPPLLLIVGTLSGMLLLWQALLSESDAHVRAMVADRSDIVRAEIQSGLSRRVQPLFALLQQQKAAPANERAFFAGLVRTDVTGVEAIEATDARGRTRWRVSSAVAAGTARPDRAALAELLGAARERGEPAMSSVDDGAAERSSFLVAIPRRSGDTFIVVTYALTEFLFDALHWPLTIGYEIDLLDNGKVVYHRGNNRSETEFATEVPVPLYGREWRLRVTPTTATVAAARSPLPTVVLFAGVLLVLTLVWVHRLGYQSKLRARHLGDEVVLRRQAEAALQRLNEELEQRVAARTEELRATNAALANEKERWAVTLHSIGDGVITTDMDGRVVTLNGVAEELTGWRSADATGRQAAEVFHIVDAHTGEVVTDPIAQALSTRKPAGLQRHTLLRRKDGRERLVADTAAPIRDRGGDVLGAVLVFRDITESQKMEEELFKAKNLESIGLLAGGIAHDFNNILTAILGNIGLAKLYSRPGDPVYETLSEAEKAFARARDLTQQLLTFSRGGAPVRTTASVGELLEETSTFVLRGSNVRHGLDVAGDLWPASIDPGQISQAINNLLLNSKQAMPHGGTISLRAENITVLEQRGTLKPGPYIRITITDQGTGIAPEHLPRIFDPYFTTKAGGTGLGLATTYSIIRRHQGHIEVESTLGVGTTFHIYLPAAPAARAENAVTASGGAARGEGRVLIMDDEGPIRDIAARSLRVLGYDVSVAADGEEAIEQYRRALAKGERYDAVILDLTIPGGMGGEECVQRLREIDPNVHAIVSSGYSNDPVVADFAHHGFDAMVTKPYDMRALAAAVQAVARKTRAAAHH